MKKVIQSSKVAEEPIQCEDPDSVIRVVVHSLHIAVGHYLLLLPDYKRKKANTAPLSV